MESSQDSRLKAVIVGCGDAGFKSHAKCLTHPSLQDRVNLIGISRTSQEKAEETVRRIREVYNYDGEIQTYSDARTMISELKPEIVVVASPHHAHYENILTALNPKLVKNSRSVKALLVEKPLVYDGNIKTSLRDARKLVDLCVKKRVFLDSTVQLKYLARAYFYNPVEVDDEGKLIVEFPSRYEGIEKWVDMGCHIIEMLKAGFSLGERWFEGERREEEGTFVLDGVINPGEHHIEVRINNKENRTKRFGFENKVWDLVYDNDRGGYVAYVDGKERREVSFVPDPMMQKHQEFLANISNLGTAKGQERAREIGERCYDSLEKMLSVLR